MSLEKIGMIYMAILLSTSFSSQEVTKLNLYHLILHLERSEGILCILLRKHGNWQTF